MVDVAADRRLVHGKVLHRILHAVKRDRLPHETRGKVVRAVDGGVLAVLELDAWKECKGY